MQAVLFVRVFTFFCRTVAASAFLMHKPWRVMYSRGWRPMWSTPRLRPQCAYISIKLCMCGHINHVSWLTHVCLLMTKCLSWYCGVEISEGNGLWNRPWRRGTWLHCRSLSSPALCTLRINNGDSGVKLLSQMTAISKEGYLLKNFSVEHQTTTFTPYSLSTCISVLLKQLLNSFMQSRPLCGNAGHASCIQTQCMFG